MNINLTRFSTRATECRRTLPTALLAISAFVLLLFGPSLFSCVAAQDVDFAIDPIRENQLTVRIMQFQSDFGNLTTADGMSFGLFDKDFNSVSHARIVGQKLQSLYTTWQSLDFRWNAFVQSEQIEISESESLMEMMAQVQQLKQVVGDSIVAQRGKCEAVIHFIEAEELLFSRDTIYRALYKKARSLSMVKRLAAQLEKIKADEHHEFEKIQAAYDKSRDAVQLIPQLNTRAARLDEQYFSLKTLSSQIQAMEYKPLIQRLKDYLIGLACVSMILVFVNMVITKFKAAKKARDAVKKQKKLLNRDDRDYPTI